MADQVTRVAPPLVGLPGDVGCGLRWAFDGPNGPSCLRPVEEEKRVVLSVLLQNYPTNPSLARFLQAAPLSHTSEASRAPGCYFCHSIGGHTAGTLASM